MTRLLVHRWGLSAISTGWLLSVAACGSSPSRSLDRAAALEDPTPAGPVEPAAIERVADERVANEPRLLGEAPPETASSRLGQRVTDGIGRVLHDRGQSFAYVFDLPTGKTLAGVAQQAHAPVRVNTPLVPASTVKPLLAWHALASGRWSAEHTVTCQGSTPDSLGRRCFHRHGEIDLATAIATSCNAYFFALVDALGREGAVAAFERAGLAGQTLPLDQWQTAALGHGALTVTGESLGAAYRALWHAAAADAKLRVIIDGLRRAVADPKGSARAAASASVAVAGKTGTHERQADDSNGEYESWFVALVPADAPEVVIVTWIRGSQTAPTSAVPVAAEVADIWQHERTRGNM